MQQVLAVGCCIAGHEPLWMLDVCYTVSQLAYTSGKGYGIEQYGSVLSRLLSY